MRAVRFLIATLTLAAVHASAADLFKNGDLSGWELVVTPAASLAASVSAGADGVISVTGAPVGFFATRASHANYRLHAEWRWTGKAGNGGVLLHINPGDFDRAWPRSLQVQTKFGSVGDVLPMAGARFSEALSAAPGAPALVHGAPDSERPAGEWNSVDIVCRDGTVEVKVNGVLQNRISGAVPATGRVGFQLEGTPYQLRAVDLTPLD